MIKILIKRKVTTAMIFLGITLLGIISLDKLPVQLLPDIEFPKLTIITAYENAAPSEVEKLVTKNIEESVSSVNGVLSINSESLEGMSLVTARFDWGRDMDMALIETKEKVDMIKGQLPEDCEKSIVVKFDPGADPVMIYSVKNNRGSFKSLRKRVEKEIVPYFERISGVASVEINGGFKREIKIDIDIGKLFSHRLSLSEVMERVSMSNYNFPAGSIIKGNREYLVRTIGVFETVDEIKHVVVGRSETGVPVYLNNIAHISDSFKDRKSIIRVNGRESVVLLIKKEPGKNTIAACEKIKDKVKELKNKRGGEFSLTKIFDQSEFIESSVNNVFVSGIIGGIIAIAVLFFFLNEAGAPSIIALSIPVSIIGTFTLMYFTGLSVNAMSLGGLALGVGMMVDSGIVVLESISDETAKGGDRVENVIRGTGKVLASVVSSTFTSIVVFLPIVFLSGLSGAIFGELALTISFALIFSLFSSVTLIPMLAVINMKWGKDNKSILFRKMSHISNGFMEYVSLIYYKSIHYSLKNKRAVLLSGVIILFIGAGLFKFIDLELMPAVDPGEFTINGEAPSGTTLDETSQISKRIESLLLKESFVKNIFSKIGSDSEESISEKISGKGSNFFQIKVILHKKRRDHINDIVFYLKKKTRAGTNINLSFNIKQNVIESILSNRRDDLHIEIYGRDIKNLKESGKRIIGKIKHIEGLVNVKSIFDKPDPELKLKIDRLRMASMGLNIADIASTLKSAVHGEAVTRFSENDDEIDIRVRLRKKDRSEMESLKKILVKSENGELIPIEKFSTIIEGTGFSKLIRKEQSRVNIITGHINGDKDDVLGKVENLIASVRLKDGYSIKLINNKKDIAATFSDMKFALILAIILIYMLLASQFQSFKNPFIVMLSIPVASIGISGALLLTGKTININSGIGIIMLAGLVVNNAIVLFDYIEMEKKQGKGLVDSIVEAGNRRIKPILMTTFTTIFTLVPIAFGIGEGSELQQPMAISVIGGLLVSTILTLIFIPTIYAIVNRSPEENSGEQL